MVMSESDIWEVARKYCAEYPHPPGARVCDLWDAIEDKPHKGPRYIQEYFAELEAEVKRLSLAHAKKEARAEELEAQVAGLRSSLSLVVLFKEAAEVERDELREMLEGTP